MSRQRAEVSRLCERQNCVQHANVITEHFDSVNIFVRVLAVQVEGRALKKNVLRHLMIIRKVTSNLCSNSDKVAKHRN